MDVLSSTPVTLWVDFEAPQGLEIPDPDTVTFSLYGSDGVVLVGNQALTPVADATGVSVPIDALYNTLSPDRSFDRRLVILGWVSQNRTWTATRRYRIIPVPIHGVTPEDVRTYLSLNEDELRDDEVDVFRATMTLQAEIGKERFDQLVAAGTNETLQVERAVVLIAATQLFPSLRYRIAASKTDGTLAFQRFKDPNAFDGLIAATADELIIITLGLTGDTTSLAVIPVLIRLTTVTTDVVTGAARV